jgi:hypothetical protein
MQSLAVRTFSDRAGTISLEQQEARATGNDSRYKEKSDLSPGDGLDKCRLQQIHSLQAFAEGT